MKYTIILPSLKTSGGILNAIELCKELNNNGIDTDLLIMWKCKNPVPTYSISQKYLSNFRTNIILSPIHIILLFLKFLFKKENNTNYIFTHYSTLPLSMAVKNKYTIFNQGVEWEFVSNPIIKNFFKKIVLSFYRKGNVITINSFIQKKLIENGINSKLKPLWASEFFYTSEITIKKDIDILIFPRKGYVKRLDLYIEFIKKINNKLKILAITPDESIKEIFKGNVTEVLFNPTQKEIKNAYQKSKIILFLSENEGFGLPPAEAMGSGCIPICRNSGGPQSYMNGLLKEYLIPLNISIEQIKNITLNLLDSPKKMKELEDFCRQEFHKKMNESKFPNLRELL